MANHQAMFWNIILMGSYITVKTYVKRLTNINDSIEMCWRKTGRDIETKLLL